MRKQKKKCFLNFESRKLPDFFAGRGSSETKVAKWRKHERHRRDWGGLQHVHEWHGGYREHPHATRHPHLPQIIFCSSFCPFFAYFATSLYAPSSTTWMSFHATCILFLPFFFTQIGPHTFITDVLGPPPPFSLCPKLPLSSQPSVRSLCARACETYPLGWYLLYCTSVIVLI